MKTGVNITIVKECCASEKITKMHELHGFEGDLDTKIEKIG